MKVFFFELIVHVVICVYRYIDREIRDARVHDRASAHSTIAAAARSIFASGNSVDAQIWHRIRYRFVDPTRNSTAREKRHLSC